MLPGKTITPPDVVAMLLRRKWLILMPFALGLSAAPLIARWVPELYRSETLISVVPQRVPDSYVRSTITASVEDRLPSINDQILSRSRLERTIADLDLYRQERAQGVMEDVVQGMRRSVTVRLEGRESFRVSFVSRDPRTAQQVTARLAELYIEENTRDRANLAEGTSVFLESQLVDAERRLIEHERTLEEYRRRHAGELPSQLGANLQAIQNLQMQLQAVNQSVNRAREHRLLVERQIADLQLTASAAPRESTISADTGIPTELQLERALEQRDINRLRYTADHPDVRSLERTIRELREKLAREKREGPPPRPPTPEELAREKRLNDLREDVSIIDKQIAELEADEVRLRAATASYQRSVDIVPTRESELVNLMRDYETLKATYESLATKREESQLAANLERRQVGERFRIVDPASLPERPFNQRQRIAAMGSASLGGLLMGLLLIGVLEYRDSSFKREEDVLRALALPVLALVPAVRTDRERKGRRFRVRTVNVVGVAMLIGSVVILVLWGVQS